VMLMNKSPDVGRATKNRSLHMFTDKQKSQCSMI